jgi:hypothetical protein
MRLLRSFATGFAFCALTCASAATAQTLDTPSLNVFDQTRASITLEVHAGSSGAPGGFIVEWMTKETYDNLGGWPSDSYYAGLSYCTFDGIPTYNLGLGTYNYVLGPNETAKVEMGDVFDETGVLANYWNELDEGHDYVFRVRAVSDGYSDECLNSPSVFASTEPRGLVNDCTLTQGFWKTHPQTWANVGSITLGTVAYTQAQLLQIFNQPTKGNGLISLAHQLIAAKLNILFGATPPASVSAAIAAADALIGGLVVPPIGSGYLDPSDTASLTQTLDDFNNGTIGPGHCPDGTTSSKSTTWGRLKTIYR